MSFKKLNLKGQASIEIILILIFLIIFLAVFSDLSQDTERLIKANKIKEQHNDIANNIYSFIKVQENFIKENAEDTKKFIYDFNLSYFIPNLFVPTENYSCEITISSTRIDLKTDDFDYTIITRKNINLNDQKIDLNDPIEIKCGQELFCYFFEINNKIKCE